MVAARDETSTEGGGRSCTDSNMPATS